MMKSLSFRFLALLTAIMLLVGCSAKPLSSTDKDSSPEKEETNVNTPTDITEQDPTDYSDMDNWAYFAEGVNKDADVFFLCPTADMGRDGNYNMSLENDNVKSKFLGAINMELDIYDENARVFAPYYRQMTFPVYNMSDTEMQPYFDIAYADVCASFEYYFENCNDGRPLVLAGFSQGSQMLLQLLCDYFDDEKYSECLVAAYCIGWRITEDDLDTYPHLALAEGELDTGSIISFNSESEDALPSIIVREGEFTYGINPLNWKTDSTFADKSLNMGACFTDYDRNILEEIPNFSGAYLDPERGTLIVCDADPDEYSSSGFPYGNFHVNDYKFFFRNLQKNVSDRIDAFLKK